MQAKLKQIADITGKENLFADHAARLAYARTANFGYSPSAWILPLACARPRHMGQVARLLEFCSREGIPVAFRGGGTAAGANAQPAVADTLLILTTGLTRILELDAENRIAHVQPGVTCAQLTAAAATRKLFYPPRPYSAATATIGGNVAMNAAGAGCAKYGSAANYVLGLDICSGNGEKINCATANVMPGKLAPGLPLASIFCGSMGSLAFIGDCALRLLPMPESVESRLFRFHNGAASAASQIMARGLLPAALEIYDPVCAAILLDEPACADWLLEIQFSGCRAETTESMLAAVTICKSCDGSEARTNDDSFRKLRAGLMPALAAKSRFRYEPFSCPPSRLPMLLDGIQDISEHLGQKVAVFGHADVAAMHAAIFEGVADMDAASREIFALELMLNNAMDSENDAAQTRWQWQTGAAGISAISQKLRPIFDPAGILANNVLPGTAQP